MAAFLFVRRFTHRRRCAPRALAGLLVGAALLAAGDGIHAADRSVAFDVNIAFTPANQTGSCSSITEGGGQTATVSVLCSDAGGAASKASRRVATGDGYRVLTRDEITAAIDTFSGSIATTAVRVVNLPGRQYIEMTVGW